MHLRIDPHGNLGQQRSESIDDHIAEARLTQRHERLVPFVHAGIGDGDYQRPQGPLDPPARTFSAHAVENGNTKCSEFGDVGKFANQEVDQVESVSGNPGVEPAEKGKDHSRRVFSAEILHGEKGDDDSDEDGGQPVFQAKAQVTVLGIFDRG